MTRKTNDGRLVTLQRWTYGGWAVYVGATQKAFAYDYATALRAFYDAN